MRVSVTITKQGKNYIIESGHGDWLESAPDARRAFRAAMCMVIRDMHDQASSRARGDIKNLQLAYEDIQGLLG